MDEPLAVVLAAGMGTRMKSDLPKVLFPLRGRPMIEYVLDALAEGGVRRTVVVIGYRADDVRKTLAHHRHLEYAEQTERLGTGHAVKMCRSQLESHDGPVLIVTGDSPMIQASSIRKLLDAFRRDRPACILGTLHKENPAGLGRIVRDERNEFMGIVEEKDAIEAQRQITEVNMSTYVFDCQALRRALDQLRNDNRQKEFYLTDCPGILKREGRDVRALPVLQPCEALSINTVDELQVVADEMDRMGYTAGPSQ